MHMGVRERLRDKREKAVVTFMCCGEIVLHFKPKADNTFEGRNCTRICLMAFKYSVCTSLEQIIYKKNGVVYYYAP